MVLMLVLIFSMGPLDTYNLAISSLVKITGSFAMTTGLKLMNYLLVSVRLFSLNIVSRFRKIGPTYDHDCFKYLMIQITNCGEPTDTKGSVY